MELLNYKTFGQGQSLVILHGFLGSLDNWLTLGKRFSENFQVYLIDQRNHGKSFHSKDWGYDEMVEDLAFFMDELSIAEPILLGHSMGGKTVMQYAAYHQENVKKLVVADINPLKHIIQFDDILAGLNAVPIDAILSREEANEVLQSYVPDVGTRSFLLKNLARSPEGFGWKMNLPVLSEKVVCLGEPVNYRQTLEVETLFVRGGRSGYVPEEAFDSIREVFSQAQFETIEGVGHWLHAERPNEFYDKVMSFLS